MREEKIFRKVAIFGYFGAGNLGDEAVVGTLLKNIHQRHPASEVVGICLNPDDTEKRHKIRAYPLRRLPNKTSERSSSGSSSMVKKIFRRLFILSPKECAFLFNSYRLLKGMDAVIVGGSGQLIDNEGGMLNHPYNYYKWSFIAKLAGVKFIFMSVGTGPLKTRTGKYLIKKSMQLASYRSFRDDYSKNLAVSLGVTENNIVCPDMAFSIDIPPEMMTAKPDHANIVVGIAPMAYMDPRHWHTMDMTQYTDYIGKMADFAAWLIETNHDILFIHTQINGDDLVIIDIMNLLAKKVAVNIDKRVSEHSVHWYTDVLAGITKADFIVASRFHAVVFSYIMNRPLVSLSYDPKVTNIMKSVEQSDFTLPIESFTTAQLIERFTALKGQSYEAMEKINEKISEFKGQLEDQYNYVL